MILETERLMRFARARAWHDRRARVPRKSDDEIMRVLAAFVRALARAADKTITLDSSAIESAITAYRIERGTRGIVTKVEESQMALLMAA